MMRELSNIPEDRAYALCRRLRGEVGPYRTPWPDHHSPGRRPNPTRRGHGWNFRKVHMRL